jgi:Uma2 family endonuclease
MSSITLLTPDTIHDTDTWGEAPLVVRMEPLIMLDDERFFQFAMQNPDVPLEQAPSGEVIFMSPTGGETGNRNIKILFQLEKWTESNQLGIAFDSATIFRLPNRAARSPDASWVELSRWNQLSPQEKEVFPPLCPDFVVELRSRSDRLKDLQAKLAEYVSCGARLAWLIDPFNISVHIYRPGQSAEVLKQPTSISGDPEMPGLVLELGEIFDV